MRFALNWTERVGVGLVSIALVASISVSVAARSDAWRNTSTDVWCDWANAANPDLVVPDPIAVAAGGPMRFLPKPDNVAPRSEITTEDRWASSAGIESLVASTSTSADIDAFLDRHISAVRQKIAAAPDLYSPRGDR